MGLVGYGPEVIKPTALALNVLVAAIGCVRFAREGLLTWRSFYPFAILGAPFSVLGGASNLPRELYQPVVGVLLLIAAVLMIRSARRAAELDLAASAEPPLLPSLLAGAVLGYVSGLTGGRRRNIFGTPRPRFRMDWDAARGRRLRGLQPFKLRRGFGRNVDDHTRNAGAVALLAAGGRTWRIAWVLDGSPLPATQSTAIHPRRASFDGRHTNGFRLARF